MVKDVRMTEYMNDEKSLRLICISFLAATIGSLFFMPLVFVGMIIGIIAIIKLDFRQLFAFLLFSFTYAGILKIDIDSLSLFTIIEMFVVIYYLFRIHKLLLIFAFSLFLLLLEMLIFAIDYLALYKVVIIMMIFYCFVSTYKENDSQLMSKWFIYGIMTSTVLGLFKERIPRLYSLYQDMNYEWLSGIKTIRFSGIYGDPNYYCIPILLCFLICLISLISGNMIRKTRAVIFLAVSVICGMATLSKSFYLGFIASIILVVCLGSYRNRFSSILLVILSLFAIVLIDPGSMFTNIITRFQMTDTFSGRELLWQGYINKILESSKTLWLGNGAGGPIVGMKYAHNGIIEIIYNIGIIGFVLYIFCIINPVVYMRRTGFRKTIINYSGFIIVAVLFFFLNVFTAYELPFYLMICYVIFNSDIQNGESILYI